VGQEALDLISGRLVARPSITSPEGWKPLYRNGPIVSFFEGGSRRENAASQRVAVPKLEVQLLSKAFGLGQGWYMQCLQRLLENKYQSPMEPAGLNRYLQLCLTSFWMRQKATIFRLLARLVTFLLIKDATASEQKIISQRQQAKNVACIHRMIDADGDQSGSR
jgi:hypothetical protein